MSEQAPKRDLANPAGPRSFSDKLDSVIWTDGYKDTSCTRGVVHGLWHTGAGIVRWNGDEFSRAAEQFGKCREFI